METMSPSASSSAPKLAARHGSNAISWTSYSPASLRIVSITSRTALWSSPGSVDRGGLGGL